MGQGPHGGRDHRPARGHCGGQRLTAGHERGIGMPGTTGSEGRQTPAGTTRKEAAPAGASDPAAVASVLPREARPDGMAEVLKQYECGPVRFTGDANASYERRLVF